MHTSMLVTDNRAKRSKSPRFSVVIALYNAAEYFNATIESLTRQSIDRDELEFIVVNDGSSDASLDMAVRWAKRDTRVVVYNQENQGIAVTRNVGLAAAQGEWITAVDPDDIVSEFYFEEVAKMMATDANNEASMYLSRVYITNGSTGQFKDTHPMRKKFHKGNRFVSLESEPHAVQFGATSFMRREVLINNDIAYDPDLHPTFEDGHVVCRYLCQFAEPIVGIVSTAHYHYRKRADNSSAVQSGWANEAKFTVQPRRGYVSVLEYAQTHLQRIPNWLATAVIYDLNWYFKEYLGMDSSVRWISPEVRSIFMDTCDEIFQYLTWKQLCDQQINPAYFSLREALGIGFRLTKSPAHVFRWGVNAQGMRSWTIHVHPEVETMEFRLNGVRTEVPVNGVKVHEYFGRPLMHEYSLLLPEGDLAVFADGIPAPIMSTTVPAPEYPASPVADAMNERLEGVAKEFTAAEKRQERHRVEAGILGISSAGLAGKVLDRKLRALRQKTEPERTDIPTAATGFDLTDCWLLLDHEDRADDNAEHLYRYLLRERPDINAYFLIERGTKDWNRLEAEGFRLIEYGSETMYAAAEQAQVVASSDAVGACMELRAPHRRTGRRPYKFVFLQHGVTQNNLSNWLNNKGIEQVIAVTRQEWDAFVWKNSPYNYTSTHVALTGFPRYDNLYRLAQQREATLQHQRALLVMPTWRRELKTALDKASNAAEQQQIMRDSDFYNEWNGSMQQIVKAAAAHSGRTRVAFFVHPNLAPYVHLLDLPAEVETIDPREVSFQETIAQFNGYLTDYSSLAFDCAYLGSDIAYYQPEHSSIGSGHSWERGYYDYETMGFGPVLKSESALADWTERFFADTLDLDGHFEARREATFAYLDGDNCLRVTETIERLLAGEGSGYSFPVPKFPAKEE